MTALDLPVRERRARSVALTRRAGTTIVVISSASWVGATIALALRRHWEYGSARFDLGNMVQAVWNTAHGRFLEMTLATGDQSSRLAVHVDPILALFAPATWVAPTAEVLIAGQAVALAAGSWPLLQLARRYLESEAAAVFLALAYLACPWIVWQTQNDFHPVVLAIPLFLYCVWFLECGRYVAFAVAAALVLACGELMGLPLIALGLWHALRTQRWAKGAVIAVVGASWTAVCLGVVIPTVGGADSPFYPLFDGVGGSPGGVVATLVTDPMTILEEVSRRSDVVYLVLLALPLLGLFLAAPLLALAAVPLLGVNLLATPPAMTSVREHYVAGVIPFLFAATALGLARFRPRRRVMLASLVFETSLVLAIAFAPWPALAVPPLSAHKRHYQEATHREAAFAAIALVPDGAAVAATGAAGAHLSERRYFYSVPVIGRADWVLLDRRDSLLSLNVPVDLHAFERRLRADGHWRTVFSRDDVVLYRRASG